NDVARIQVAAAPADPAAAPRPGSIGPDPKLTEQTTGYKPVGSSRVDLKSTIVDDRFALLLVDVFLDHVVSDRPRGDCKVASSPEVLSPKLAAQMRELLKEYPRADALQPLDDLADRLLRAVRDEDMHMVTGHLAGDN